MLLLLQDPSKGSLVSAPMGHRLYGKDGARFVDRVSRYLFPAVFLLFNIIYWLIYTFLDLQ